MEILDVIDKAQSGRAMANLAQSFNIPEDDARKVADIVMPELAFALERNTLSRGGLADFVRALGDGHHESVLEEPRSWQDPRVRQDGSDILVHILGSEGKVDKLTDRAARATGLGGGLIEALLPILAQMLMGAISRYMRGGLGDVLSKLPIPGGGKRDDSETHETGGTMRGDRRPGGFDLPQGDVPPQGGYRLPWPGSSDEQSSRRPQRQSDERSSLPQSDTPSGGGYQLPPYDPNAGGGVRDDAPSRGDRGGFPLPGPGSEQRDNPYGDLSDILRRRGGAQQPAPDGGGSLWDVIRKQLGGGLGFGGRGVIGWIIQLVLLRWGWSFLKRILTGR